jgi:hypothetical protein
MSKVGLIRVFVVLALGFILVAGCSNLESDENIDTIRTFLENEFTGPNDELINAFGQEDPYPPELQGYLEENYKPHVADPEQFLSKNHVLLYLRFAYENGYQLNPENIEIQKVTDSQTDAYNFEVKVKYSKDSQTNTATITGRINMNNDGKISIIRNVNGEELLENLRQ